MQNQKRINEGFDRLFDIDAKTRRDIPLNFTCKLEDYVSENYGRAKVLDIMGIRIYFSYETPIAVELPGETTKVTTKSYSATTGRHKSYIPHLREYRIDQDTFLTLLRSAIIEAGERVKQTKGVE